jgi:curli production assembly/transport component CsgG
VLKTVHTTKSIISQQLDSGVFRFIDTNRLLEAEAGYTYNEPPVMAVTEAIDEAVKQLILEGVEADIWTPKNADEIAAYRDRFNFEKQKEEQLQRDYFGLIDQPDLRGGWSLTTNGFFGTIIGNYSNPDVNPGVMLQVEKGVTRNFSLRLGGQRTRISAPNAFSNPVNAADLLLNVYITPGYNLSPFMAAGGGAFIFDKKYTELDDQILPFIGLETGFDYRFNNRFGVRASASYRYLLIDGLDGVSMGKYNDQHWGVNLGFIYQPGFLN